MKKAILVMLSLLAIALLVVGCAPRESSTEEKAALTGEGIRTSATRSSTPANACTSCDNTFRTALNTYISCRNSCGTTAGTTGSTGTIITVNEGTIIADVTTAIATADDVQAVVLQTLENNNQAFSGVITTTANPTYAQKAENTKLICNAQNTAKIRKLADWLPAIITATETIETLNNYIEDLNEIQSSYGNQPINPTVMGVIESATAKIAELEQTKQLIVNTITDFDTWPRNVYVCTGLTHYAVFRADCNARTTAIVGAVKTCSTGKACIANNLYFFESEVCKTLGALGPD